MKITTRYALVLLASLVLMKSAHGAIPTDPVASFAWTNATSATCYDNFVFATSTEGVMTFFEGYPVSHIALPSPPTTVRHTANLFLILTRSDELFLIDINNAGGLTLVARFDPGGNIEDIAFDTFSIFLARGFDGLWRYDYTIAGGFTWIDSSLFPIHCTDLVLKDSLLFAVDDYNGLLVYNIYAGGLDLPVEYHPCRYQINELIVFDQFVAATTENDVLLGGVFNWATNQVLSLDSVGSVRSDDLYAQGTVAYAIADDSLRLVRWRPTSSMTATSVARLTLPIRPSISLGVRETQSGIFPTFAAAQDGTIISFNPAAATSILGYAQFTTTTGPFSHIELVDSTLYVGGSNYPLQSFHLNTEGRADPPRIVIPGLINVRDFDLRNDSLLVLSPHDGAVLLYSIRDPEDPQLLRRISVDTTKVRDTRFLDAPGDSVTVIGMSGDNQVKIYAIRDTLVSENTTNIFMLGRILDYEIVDSLLIILSNKRVMDVYRLKNDLSSSFRGSTSVAGLSSGFFRVDQTTTLASGQTQRLFLVAGSTLSRLDVSIPASPFFDIVTDVGFSISETDISGDTIFAIGRDGLARFELRDQIPVLTQLGGRPGQFVSRAGSLIATSSGESVSLFAVEFDTPTDVDEEIPDILPTSEILRQNWPNPFNPTTTIPYSLPTTSHVRLSIYNLLGQEIDVLVDEMQEAGDHTLIWNGHDRNGQQVATGLYFYRLELPDRVESRKMVLIR